MCADIRQYRHCMEEKLLLFIFINMCFVKIFTSFCHHLPFYPEKNFQRLVEWSTPFITLPLETSGCRQQWRCSFFVHYFLSWCHGHFQNWLEYNPIETYCQTIIIYISQEFVELKLKMQKMLQKSKRMGGRAKEAHRV